MSSSSDASVDPRHVGSAHAVFTTDSEPLRETFPCAGCDKQVAMVTLWPAGRTDPRRIDPPGIPPGASAIGIEHPRLAIDGGPVPVVIHPLSDVPAIIRALSLGDPAALFAIDREFAPFWCPDCLASYCAAHWAVEVTYDDGFYDAHYGTCPEGHRRMLMD